MHASPRNNGSFIRRYRCPDRWRRLLTESLIPHNILLINVARATSCCKTRRKSRKIVSVLSVLSETLLSRAALSGAAMIIAPAVYISCVFRDMAERVCMRVLRGGGEASCLDDTITNTLIMRNNGRLYRRVRRENKFDD